MEVKKNQSVDNERLKWPIALIGGLFVSGLVLASFTFESPVFKEKLADVATGGDNSTVQQEEVEKPEEQQPEEEPVVEATPPAQEEIEHKENEEEKPKPKPPTPPPAPPAPVEKPVKKAEIIEFPDVEASFPGGQAELQRFIVNNIQYPETSIDMEEQGRVYLSFVVDADGTISSIKVDKGVSPDLDREAKRVVRSMPKWNPGEAGGKKVPTRCRLPIVFTLH